MWHATGIPRAMSTALGRTDAQANQELIALLRELAHTARTTEPLTLNTSDRPDEDE